MITDLQRSALSYFVGMGWTPAQAAGIVANLVAESNLNPAAVGDGGQAYGIAQWHPDRQVNFAAVIGKDIHGSSLADQLAFVHAELRNFEKAAGDALEECTTASEAGACVSKKYERPADREGEATHRGALAESLLAQYVDILAPAANAVPTGVEQAPISTPQQPEQPMGAGLLLQALLPSVLGMFAPRAQAAISKVTGQPPEVSGAFLQDLFTKISGVTGQVDPVQAVAALQKAPAEAVKAVEDHALDYLDKVAPLFDKLAAADAAQNAAAISRMDAASVRAARDRWDMTRALVAFAGCTSTILVLALLAAIIYQAVTGEKKIDVALVGLAGPLLAIAMGVWREIFAYRFDGTQASSTAAAINEQLAKIK